MKTPKKEIYSRIAKLQSEMQKKNIDATLILQKTNLFYLSGTAQDAHLFIPANGMPYLMVKKDFERAKKESSIISVVQIKSIKEIFSYIQKKPIKNIALEADVLPANIYLKYQSFLEPIEICDISKIIKKIKMIKSQYEIDILKQAADMHNKLFSAVPSFLKSGITELELAGNLEAVSRKNGHQGFVRMRGFNQELFYGHIMSGASATTQSFFNGPTGGSGTNPSFPQGAGYNKIKKNEPVLIDYTGIYNGYIVDQTRIFSIGEISKELLFAHEIALKIKEEIIKKCKPKTNGKDLFDIAIEIATDAGLSENFMGFKKNRPTFVGHGVGLELDEMPVIAKNFNIEMKEKMVIALEPKFIFPEQGVVGVEDTFFVTKDGLKQITYFDDALQIL